MLEITQTLNYLMSTCCMPVPGQGTGDTERHKAQALPSERVQWELEEFSLQSEVSSSFDVNSDVGFVDPTVRTCSKHITILSLSFLLSKVRMAVYVV